MRTLPRLVTCAAAAATFFTLTPQPADAGGASWSVHVSGGHPGYGYGYGDCARPVYVAPACPPPVIVRRPRVVYVERPPVVVVDRRRGWGRGYGHHYRHHSYYRGHGHCR